MLRLLPLPALSFSLLLLCRLASAQSSGFSYGAGGLNATDLSLNPLASVSSSGDLVLNGSTSFAEALYSKSFSLTGISFNTYFSISAGSTSANGTFAFVIVGNSTFGSNYENDSNAVAVVFNNTCYSDTGYGYGSDQWEGRGLGGGRGHRFGGRSIMQPVLYAGGQPLSPTTASTPFPWQNGPEYYGPNSPSWPTNCSTTDLAYEYEVAVQYNASAKQVTFALGSACYVAGQVFYSQDLSTILTDSAYVGFVASDGAIYTLTQWNFTTNALSSVLSSIAASIASSSTTPSSNGATPSSPGSSSGGSKLNKGYVVGFTLLGGAIGLATLVGACFLYRKRKVVRTTQMQGAGAAKFQSTPTKGMAMNTKTTHEYDTSPLYPPQSRTSSADNASWLKPVAPR